MAKEIEKVVIDREFQNLCPGLSDAELGQLEQNIEQDGFRDPIVAWKDPDGMLLLVDGHNRFDVWRNLPAGVKLKPPEIVHKDFESREEAIDWIIDNQLGRRNLNEHQKAHLIGRKYNARKVQHGGDRNASKTADKKTLDASKTPEKQGQKAKAQSELLLANPAAEEVAAETGVSRESVKRAGEYEQSLERIGYVNGKAKADILGGSLRVSRKDVTAIGKLSSFEIGKALNALRRGEKWQPTAPEEKAAKRKTPKRVDWKRFNKLAGDLERYLTEVAKATGQKEGPHHRAAKQGVNDVIKAFKKMKGAA